MKNESRYFASIKEEEPVLAFDGIWRRTLAYNKDNMLCHFIMHKGAKTPLHKHLAVQSGYVVSGSVKFLFEDGSSFIAEKGQGYLFESLQQHGAEVLEEAELIECFTPYRPEFIKE